MPSSLGGTSSAPPAGRSIASDVGERDHGRRHVPDPQRTLGSAYAVMPIRGLIAAV